MWPDLELGCIFVWGPKCRPEIGRIVVQLVELPELAPNDRRNFLVCPEIRRSLVEAGKLRLARDGTSVRGGERGRISAEVLGKVRVSDLEQGGIDMRVDEARRLRVLSPQLQHHPDIIARVPREEGGKRPDLADEHGVASLLGALDF